MIERYQTKEIAQIWAEESKFDLWLKLELAVLDARAKLGRLEPETAKMIRSQAKYDIARIAEIEKDIEHDLLAFVEAVRENLDLDLRGEFHRGMTSFDTEEIPMMMRLRQSICMLENETDALIRAAKKRVLSHKETLMIGRTHSQHAKPITFGFKVLGWVDIFRRDLFRLNSAKQIVSVGKLSGAVGVYSDEVDPVLESEVCRTFALEPARHTTQIIHRDRIAQVMSYLAILAADMEYVATEIRHLAQTEIGEVREPRKEKQKGSSAMPHKRNPITAERICGLARVVRTNLLAALENIATWSERDISQSSVERIILPDSFHAVHYMIRKLAWIIQNMEVDSERMLKNLELTQGCVYSEDVKTLLCSWGIDPEEVYKLLQECAFEAMDRGKPFYALVCKKGAQYFDSPEKTRALQACFNPKNCLKHIDKIFHRFF